MKCAHILSRKNQNLKICLILTACFETCLLLLWPRYWFIETLFSVCVGFSLACMLEYIFDDKSLIQDYFGIVVVCVIALMPMFLTGFYYGDTYSHGVGWSAGASLSGAIAMRRPFVGITSALFGDYSTEESCIVRIVIGGGLILSGLLLYKFVNEKFKSRTLAYILCIFLCASVVAVDCFAYLAVYPIVYSLLFSIIAYLAWERFADEIQNGFCAGTILYGFIFASSLLTAFCFYQIGTPVFFVMLVISVLSEQQSDKGVLKKGICATFSYGAVAVFYLLFTSGLQKLYHIGNIQGERSKFIHTMPQIVQKLKWFFHDVIPQSIHRIWATVLPGGTFTTKNLFYTISYRNRHLQILLIAATVFLMLFLLVGHLRRRRWQKSVGCLCGVFLSFYPFLILPESTVLTYYMLPLIMLLEVFFVLGIWEIIRCAKRLLEGRSSDSGRKAKQIVILILSVFVAVNSARYANNWVSYCRDSFQYLKMSILPNKTDETRNIHVYGKISPYVGGNPYVIFSVQCVLKEINEDPAEYTITQADTPYAIDQLTQKNDRELKEVLSKQDYERFMGYYIYSEFYHCYYIATNWFTSEEQEFLKGCLERAGLTPSKDDKTTLIISMAGFNQTHPF